MLWCITGSSNGREEPHLPQVLMFEASLGQRGILTEKNIGFEVKKGKEMTPQLTEREGKKKNNNYTKHITQILSYF